MSSQKSCGHFVKTLQASLIKLQAKQKKPPTLRKRGMQKFVKGVLDSDAHSSPSCRWSLRQGAVLRTLNGSLKGIWERTPALRKGISLRQLTRLAGKARL
eukprot:4858798-Prorocentrum_lima.AAC.1